VSYKSCAIDGLYVLRWQSPEVPDVAAYAGEIAAASSKQGKQLVGLFIMPEDSDPPGEQFRKEQANKLPEIMTHLTFVVAVFEGTGFMAAMKRSALVGILLLSGRRFPMYVRATVDEALVSSPPQPISFEPKAAIAELGRRGMLTEKKKG
jgi:hypothetical protein